MCNMSIRLEFMKIMAATINVLCFRTVKKLLKFTWLPLALAGCVGDNSQGSRSANSTQASLVKSTAAATAAVASTTIDNSNSPIFTVGGTYDSMSMHPTYTKTCLNVGNNDAYLTIDNPQATLDFSSETNSTTVQNALGMEYTATLGWGPFAITKSYEYARSSQDD